MAAFLIAFSTFLTSPKAAAQAAQGTPAQAQSDDKAGVSKDSTAALAADGDDGDNDADMPPTARGHISEAEYIRMREEHVGTLRGLGDLARNPTARSQAIGKMAAQEQSLSRGRSAAASIAGQIAAPVTGPQWIPLGPDPIHNGQTTPVAPVSGRVTAIAVDPGNENIVYVGTAQGGVYRSVDGGTTWQPLMDSALSLAIGTLTLDPTDPSILFVGTGEGNLSLDSFFGVGLYIITNANSTTASPALNGPFNAPAPSNPDAGTTDVFTGRSITRILVNPNNHSQILVSTADGLSGASGDPLPGRPTRGVYVSNNVFSAAAVGTPTFARLSIQTGTLDDTVTDMVMDPGDPNTVLAAVMGSNAAGSNDGGIWATKNAWTASPSWTLQNGVTASATFFNSTPTVKFAASRSTAASPVTTFFAAFDESPACIGGNGLLRSSPDGLTWTDIPNAAGFCGGQCWYDMAVAVHPTDATKIYLGGASGHGAGTCNSGIMGISTDGVNFAESDGSLHADSHATVVSAHNPQVVYAGNDGGIYRSNDAGKTWTSLNTPGFTATQFESLAVHPTDPKFTIGGTQDNGTEMRVSTGAWFRADFGDGGFSAIDQNATDTTNVTMYHTYFNATNFLIGFAAVTSTANAHDNGWVFFGCGGNANGIGCGDGVLFYAPLALGPGNPNTVYFGTDHLYRSTSNGVTTSVVSQAPFAEAISAIGISPQDDNFRLVGLATNGSGAGGHVFASTTPGATTMTDVTGPWPAAYVARAVFHPTVKTTAYITLDGYGTHAAPLVHVWKTTNLSDATAPVTTVWTPASGSGANALPDVPVNAFTIDPASPSSIYAGTDIGVFNSNDGGLTWAPYGTGLPRVAVFDMKFTAGRLVRIATHGRGMWEIPAVTLATSTTLAASASSTTFGTPVTLTAKVNTNGSSFAPTGTMTFFDGTTAMGSPVSVNSSGQATLTTSTLAVATHSITAQYSGDLVYSASASPAQTVTVMALATSTTLGASANSTTYGTPVTLTAKLNTNGSSFAPTGTMTFFDGTTAMGSPVSVNSSGQATLTTSTLAVATHSITAQYSGDGVYLASTAPAQTIAVGNAPNADYGVGVPNFMQSAAAGSPVTYSVKLWSINGFAGNVTFSCSGLPPLSQCAATPQSVALPSNGTGSSTMTITTTANVARQSASLMRGLAASGGLFGLLAIFGFATKDRRKRSLLLMLGILSFSIALVACGGGHHATGTPAGAYSVTISGTSGSVTHTSTVVLTVQ